MGDSNKQRKYKSHQYRRFFVSVFSLPAAKRVLLLVMSRGDLHNPQTGTPPMVSSERGEWRRDERGDRIGAAWRCLPCRTARARKCFNGSLAHTPRSSLPQHTPFTTFTGFITRLPLSEYICL